MQVDGAPIRRREMMRLSDICFVSAVLAATAGMGLGIWMGAASDFALAPAHAHLNLLGWVSTAMMGLYYRGSPAGHWRLARLQVVLAVAGFWTMPLALGGYLWTSDTAFVPVIMAGSVMALAAMVLFAAIVVRSAGSSARTIGQVYPESG
jgi:hypothetical protein